MRRIVVGLGVLVLLGAAMVATATVPEHRTSYHGAVFTPDGSAVVAIRRDLEAWAFGPGWEMLTPPARVRIRSDRYHLVRLDRATGEERVITRLPPGPLEGTWISAYRTQYGYGYPEAGFQWHGTRLDWHVALTASFSGPQRIYAIASTSSPPAWTTAATSSVAADDRAVLSGDDEVIVLPTAPCAILLLNAARRTVRVLSAIETCGRASPAVAFDQVWTYARRPTLERLARIQATRDRIVAAARARGANEGQAELEAIDELERAGDYPRPAQIVATLFSREDADALRRRGSLTPLFRISAMEFRVGLFQDIEAALASPGTEVRFGAPYLRHRDFTTSEALNAFFQAGGHDFYLETDAGVAALHLVPPRDIIR